jgi:hypothetical protein
MTQFVWILGEASHFLLMQKPDSSFFLGMNDFENIEAGRCQGQAQAQVKERAATLQNNS